MNHYLTGVVCCIISVTLTRLTWALPWEVNWGSLTHQCCVWQSLAEYRHCIRKTFAVPEVSWWLTYGRVHIHDLFKKNGSAELVGIFRTWKPKASWVYSSWQNGCVEFPCLAVCRVLWNIKARQSTEIWGVSVRAVLRTTGRLGTPQPPNRTAERSPVSLRASHPRAFLDTAWPQFTGGSGWLDTYSGIH